MAHCVTPYKQTERDIDDDARKKLQANIAIPRSRVERYFAFLNRFKFMNHTAKLGDVVEAMFHLVVEMDHLRLWSKDQYAENSDRVTFDSFGSEQFTCDCEFNSTVKAGEARAWRSDLLINLPDYPEPAPSKAAKRPRRNDDVYA